MGCKDKQFECGAILTPFKKGEVAMSKILNFPKVVAYVIRDVFHFEDSKIVHISDYQKDHKTVGYDDEHLAGSPKKPPSQVIDDDDDSFEEEDYIDKRSSADKAIYFSSFISF
jgi:hypothetical protein